MVRLYDEGSADDEFGRGVVGGWAGGLRCILRFQLMILTRLDYECSVFAGVGRGSLGRWDLCVGVGISHDALLKDCLRVESCAWICFGIVPGLDLAGGNSLLVKARKLPVSLSP